MKFFTNKSFKALSLIWLKKEIKNIWSFLEIKFQAKYLKALSLIWSKKYLECIKFFTNKSLKGLSLRICEVFYK